MVAGRRPELTPEPHRRSHGPRAALQFRPDIQGLRALAVILVALNHAGVSFLTGGYIGVDVFFVLSGFLITGLLLAEASNPIGQGLRDFYSRRARRILPAAALTLVATDIVANAVLNFVRAKAVLQDSIPASLFVANIHFANQGANYFAQGQPPSPIQHFWSLSVEEQFYVVWPLLLLTLVGGAVWRKRSQRHAVDDTRVITDSGRRRVLIAVAMLGLASVAWSIYDTHSHPASAYFSTSARVWELGLGAALALAATRVGRLPAAWRAGLGWAGIAAIVVAAVAYSGSTEFPGYAALLPTLGAALVIGAGIGHRQSAFAPGRLLSLAPLRFIGDRSYTFYLWHWPVLILVAEDRGHSLSVGTNLLLLLIAFALSIVTYAVFENPIRRAGWTFGNRGLLLWPACVLAVIVVAGYQINHIDQREALQSAVGAPQYPGASGTPTTANVTSLVAHASGTPTGQPLPAVVAAVAQVEKGAPIPQVLHPTPANLLADHYSPAPGCEASGTETSSRICRLGDVASHKTIAIVGDSHAEMWIPALTAMARRDGWALLPINKSSCTPYDWYVGSAHTADCSAWYRWMQQEVARLQPTITIVSGAFLTFNAQQAPQALQGLTLLLNRLKQSSGSVGTIGDDTKQSSQPVDCLLSPQASMRRCSSVDTGEDIDVQGTVRDVTAAAGGQFIDTSGWFCARGYCPMVVGDTVVYRDSGGHVTVTYMDSLANVFRTAFHHAFPGLFH
jgi:peptidoglycan/LPS O-acetylase OafA/YrhL